jgi:hypothetical protein
MTTVPRADPIAYAVFVPIVAVDNVLPVHGHHGHKLRIETHIEAAFKAALIFEKQLGTALALKALHELAIRNQVSSIAVCS